MPESNPVNPEIQRVVLDEPPPFLGKWSRVYRFVLVYLAVVIAVFYWFTVTYRP